MAEDREAIPGNRDAFRRLCELMKTGEAIAFVGAGASAGLYPLWAALIARLADEAVSRGRASEADRRYWLKSFGDYPDQVVRGIKTPLGDGIYAEALREIFRPREGSVGDRFTVFCSGCPSRITSPPISTPASWRRGSSFGRTAWPPAFLAPLERTGTRSNAGTTRYLGFLGITYLERARSRTSRRP
jgi:hypothetical protein